jgi:dipeptidyl aminopeptidase/acylaminoacyl peptidase
MMHAHWRRLSVRLAIGTFLPALVMILAARNSSAQSTYQKPSPEIVNVLLAPAPPMAIVNPQGTEMLLAEPIRYPPISELARPMLRIAGIRIDPANFGQHAPQRFTHLSLVNVADGRAKQIPFAYGEGFGRPEWAPDGKHFFLTLTADKTVELWIGDATNASIHRIPAISLNTTLLVSFGQNQPQPCSWAPGSRELLCRIVPANPGKPPAEPGIPEGPIVRQSFGKAAPAPTFEDMLTSPFDEQEFDYYAKAQLALVTIATGKSTLIGKPAIFNMDELSPNGRLILVSEIHPPYSYVRPFEDFAHTVEVWDSAGRIVYKAADVPLQETIPIGGVASGPRDYQWQPSSPSTLVWAEALDGGNPRAKADYRDKLMEISAPFTAQPTELTRTEFRFTRIFWGERGDLAIVSEIDRADARARTWFLNLQDASAKPRLVWDMNALERYKNPGLPLMHMLANGHTAVIEQGENIFLAGEGASPEGDRPFLDRLNTQALQSERLFHCDDKSYEEVVALSSADGPQFITRRESRTEPPNYFLHAADSSPRALSHYADPNPQLLKIRKQLVTYKRADGVPLSMTIYLPPDYKEGQRYPAVVWAYPVEFSDPRVAGEVTGSPNRFTEFTGLSPLWFLLDGYVVLDNATMPVVGPPRTANDTYVEQIVSSAKAAIDKAADMGIVDPNRVGVGGHSYGAFMTANLLAHSTLFRAGVARSGAYNRTLTPFGFQNERRSFWQASQVYFNMSPFMFANQFHAPILLIHGMADNNSGTFPIQSQRLFMALKGNGASVRYVQLPDEAHGYTARESIEDMIWEMLRWFDLYVKPATPAQQAGK